ncbi:MAG: hypothetical protein Ct9H300mP1_14380 [Planctomycetaceae bacterium]|nr:MAG: hypothetical protein Ct9H300mP1_14380 [Planctomycetaceae bacterium]
MLDDTLVIWGGELGRTPVAQKPMAAGGRVGRDHQIEAFTMWMAGGGVRPGQVIGTPTTWGVCRPRTAGMSMTRRRRSCTRWAWTRTVDVPLEGREFRLTDIHGEVKPELFSRA